MRNGRLNSTSSIALVLAAVCWGAATVITKHVLTDIPPLTLLVLQLTVSVVFLWAIVLVQRLRLPGRSDIVRLGGIGILNPGLAYTFGLLGLTRTTASMSTLLWAAEPILILVLAWLILRERLTRTLIAFSVLAIIGVVLVARIDVGVDQTSLLLGNGLILIGVACCALYKIGARKPTPFKGWDEARQRNPMIATVRHGLALAFYPVIRHNRRMVELRKSAYQYRLWLTNGQQRLLERQLEECRWVYNQTLAVRRDAWEQQQETLGLYDTQALLPDWKAERRSLKLVHSQVLQNVQVRVDLAFKAFFRRVKAGEQDAGYPRFKGYGRYDSMTYPQYGNGVRLEGARLTLSKIGAVQINLHRPVEGRIKTVTLRQSSTGKWFVAFAVERPLRAPAGVPEAAVGVDVGLEKFATLSTGETVDNPRFFRDDEKDLKRAQRRLSEQPKGSLPRVRRRKIVARIHERIANRRKNFAHQQSRKLVNSFGVIVFEDLSITRMIKNHSLAKSIADAAWGELATYTQYKAEDAGAAYIEIDPRGTSQRCSRCGAVVKKSLSVRVHQCPHCGLEIDRDLNAAYNILRLGLQSQGRKPQEAHVL